MASASHFVLINELLKTTEFKSISLACNTNQKNNQTCTWHQGVTSLQQGICHWLGIQHHLRDVLFEHGSGSLQRQMCHIKEVAKEKTDDCRVFARDLFWWLLMNIKNYPGPVSRPQPPHRWHGYEGHPEGRGKLQSSPSPAGYRAPLSLSYPRIELLSCRRSDRLCNLKRNPDLLLIDYKDSRPHMDTTI